MPLLKDKLKALVQKTVRKAEVTTESMERMKKTVEAMRKTSAELKTPKV